MKSMGETTQEVVEVWILLHTHTHTHNMKVGKTLCGGLNTKNGVKTGVDILQGK